MSNNGPTKTEDSGPSVGYRCPPRPYQFQKGKSGNPSGRPKRRKSPQQLVVDASNEHVIVHENGVSRKITKRQAAAKQLANRAAKGELASLKLLVQFLATAGPFSPPPALEKDPHSARQVILERLAQIRLNPDENDSK